MKKTKSIILLAIIGLLLAALTFLTLFRFSVGLYDCNSILGAIKLDYDMAGGTSYTLTLADDNDEEVKDINEVLSTLSARFDYLGYSDYSLTAVRPVSSSIDSEDVQYDIRVSTRTSDSIGMDIQTVAAYGTVKIYAGTEDDPTTQVLTDKKAIESAVYAGETTANDGTKIYLVTITFTEYGYEGLIDIIDGNDEATTLKIALGKEDTILRSEISKGAFSNRAVSMQISENNGGEAQARSVALKISTGGLAYKYDISSSSTISPVLGENTGLYSVIAISILLVASVVAFLVKNKGYAIIAFLTLLTFILTLTAMLIAVPGIVLSFDGVIGILLATVLAIDGVFVVSKRINEEFSKGKTVKAAVRNGFKRSFRLILDTSVVAEIFALLMYFIVGGTLKCFAITLGIGALISFLATVLVLRLFTALVLSLPENKENFLNLKRDGE